MTFYFYTISDRRRVKGDQIILDASFWSHAQDNPMSRKLTNVFFFEQLLNKEEEFHTIENNQEN